MSATFDVDGDLLAAGWELAQPRDLPGTGWLPDPADIYAVLGSLATLATRLTRELAQMQSFRPQSKPTSAGFGWSARNTPVTRPPSSAHWTWTAAVAAEGMQHALKPAHPVATLAARTGPPTTGPPINVRTPPRPALLG